MMFAFAPVLLLVLLAGGMNDADLVTLIQPKAYFESRQVRLSIDSMIDIVIAEPKDNKAQVRQLTALRYLSDESDAFKKAPACFASGFSSTAPLRKRPTSWVFPKPRPFAAAGARSCGCSAR